MVFSLPLVAISTSASLNFVKLSKLIQFFSLYLSSVDSLCRSVWGARFHGKTSVIKL